MSRESLKTLAEKDHWTWGELCRAHAYNTGEDMSMEKRAVVETEQEKKAHEQVKKDLTEKADTNATPPKKQEEK